MFLEIDVVNFSDNEIPFVSIILNASLVRQVQRIDNGIQSRYLEQRAEQAERYEEAPHEVQPPSPVEELPSCGAVIYMTLPQLGTYYTVTPYEEVRQQLRDITRSYSNKEEGA